VFDSIEGLAEGLAGDLTKDLTGGLKVIAVGKVLFPSVPGDRIPNLNCKMIMIRLKAEPTPNRLQNNLLEKDSLIIFKI